MKNLTYYEKKNAALGLILMSALITLYIFFTADFQPAEIFRVMFPVVWGVYSILLILSLIIQKRQTVVFVSNDWVLRAANFLCVIGLIVGYSFYVYPCKKIYLQQTSLTVYVIFLMFLYIWSVFKEKSRCKLGYENIGMCGVGHRFEGLSDLEDLLKEESKDSSSIKNKEE